MPAGGRPGITLPAVFILAGCLLRPAVAAELAAAGADASPNSATAVRFQFYAAAPELSYAARMFPPLPDLPFQPALAYFHPLVMRQTFSPDHAGPDRLLLPEGRVWSADLVFSLQSSGDTRMLIPDAAGASLTVAVFPGRVSEEWNWPDGLVLTRVCFQPPDPPGLGVRFVLHNQSRRTFNGMRIEARLTDPEIRERNTGIGEADDELFADPRTAILFQRDWRRRDESWLALGWSPEGGLISAGEYRPTRYGEGRGTGQDMLVSIESPAQDLAPGQTVSRFFWMTWTNDRDSASAQFEQLRRHEGYWRWDQRVKAGAASPAMVFRCADPALTHWFEMLKAWAPWTAREDAFGQAALSGVGNPSAEGPESVSFGTPGLIAFGLSEPVRRHAESWLDQRLESPDAAYAVLEAYRYAILTGNRTWLANQGLRLQELLEYLKDLDRTGDGLPEFDYAAAGVEDARTRCLQQLEPSLRSSVQFLGPAVAAAAAYRVGAELLASLNCPEYAGTVQICRDLAARSQAALMNQFWNPELGRKGFFGRACVLGAGTVFPALPAGAIDAVRYGLLAPEQRRSVLDEFWDNPAWVTPRGRYWGLLPAPGDYAPASAPDFARTHEIILEGLINPERASQALRFLRRYVLELVQDPRRLGIPGGEGVAAVDIPSLNGVELVTRGLCGLEPTLEGLRIRTPLYAEALEAEVRGWPVHGGTVNVRVRGTGGGSSRIVVNGVQSTEPVVLRSAQLRRRVVEIEILRSANPQGASPRVDRGQSH